MRTWTLIESGDWVHGDCRLPSPAVALEKNLLNIMIGGPHHNVIAETQDLATNPDFAWVHLYEWTPKKIIGSVSGREARVWEFIEIASAPVA